MRPSQSGAKPFGKDSSGAFKPITVHRTFQTIIERIVDAIDAEGLVQGDRLPNEKDMAEMLQVSRPTLRQALRVLENSGVLLIRPGQAGGIFVASEMIPAEVLGQKIALEADHVAELITARRMIEPIVYHMAAENASDRELDQIADTIVLMQKHIDQPNIVLQADGMFHRRIAHATGNQVLRRTMNGIYRELNPLRGALSQTEDRAQHMIEVHTRQLQAIRQKDHCLIDRFLEETFVDLEIEFNVTFPFGVRYAPRQERG
ncbi:FadR/GntR family transcriptional regulator [Martelella alba]|nr:FCD domain-containing protein [Martelella alba]